MKRTSSRAQPRTETLGAIPQARLWPVLLGVWFVAFALRSLYLWQISSAPFFDLRIGDAESYHLWARRIADGGWLGRDIFYQAPLYPYVLALIYRVLGDGVVPVRLMQAVIGATSCALLGAAGISLFGRAGALAGLGLALYPPAIFLDGLLEKSSLVTFLTAALLALLATRPEKMNAPRWFAAGVTLGLLTLTRENALLLAVPILLWIGLGPWRTTEEPDRRRTPDLKVRPTGAVRAAVLPFVVGCTVTLLPVGLRNLAVGGEFHLTTAQFGPNFYIGNHAGASGTYEALVVGHGSAADEREDAIRLAEHAAGRTLSPAEVSSYWTNRSLAFIRAQPSDWIKLMVRKLALTFNAAEISDTESQDVYADWSWLLRLLRPFDFGVLLGLAVLGAGLTVGSWKRLWFLYALAATYAFSVILFYVFARYRFPIVPVLMILATGGLIELRAHLQPRRLRTLGLATAAAVIALVVSYVPIENPRASRATHYLGIATLLSKDPTRFDDALAFYKRALEDVRDFPAAQFGAGTLLARLDRTEEAIPYYRASLASWPTHVEARYNLGLALAAAGQWQEATEQYQEALRHRPDDPDTHLALAKAFVTLERPDLAMPHYQQGLGLQPTNAKALVGMGVALAQLGRPEEAIAKFRLALELDPRDAAAHNSMGWTLAREGRLGEAVPHFERAVALNPRDEKARKNLEQARQLQGSGR